jgi:DNA ligase D-like protein (predicted 3'-phosphoesterase)
MADLEEYRAKRHAGKTPEPLKGSRKRKSGAPIFVVQRHSARRLHYDLRLERDGVLLSWALPRGVPLRGGERSLAVHVEDHPLEYATFEGDIPAGQYGAGWVEVWDRGTYEIQRERPDGTLTVILRGGRLNGEWALVPARLDGEERNWLIVRAAKDGAVGPVREYAPMRAREAKRMPSGPGWAFEIAWDGTRALAPMEGARARFEHGGGDAIDSRTKALLNRMPRAVRTSECVLDGVICAFPEGVAYVVFDVLELEGAALLDTPWSQRHELLAGLLDDHVGEVRLSRAYDDGAALREAGRAQGLGVVAKRRDSRYRPGVVGDDWRLLS